MLGATTTQQPSYTKPVLVKFEAVRATLIPVYLGFRHIASNAGIPIHASDTHASHAGPNNQLLHFHHDGRIREPSELLKRVQQTSSVLHDWYSLGHYRPLSTRCGNLRHVPSAFHADI